VKTTSNLSGEDLSGEDLSGETDEPTADVGLSDYEDALDEGPRSRPRRIGSRI
jgi:hypothetical protein